MDEREPLAGPQFDASRPVEQEAVRTTIVGGRPPGSGQPPTNVCRGWEVLLKKASVDPEFKQLLIKRRAAAAEEIGLQLEPAEVAMLTAATPEHLEAVIAAVKVPEEHRRVFLSKSAAAMLVALGWTVVALSTCTLGSRPDPRQRVAGIRPDQFGPRPTPEPPPPVQGIRPDTPPPAPIIKGIEPDLPPPKPEPPPTPPWPAPGGVRPG
jgi:hypothetical protein